MAGGVGAGGVLAITMVGGTRGGVMIVPAPWPPLEMSIFPVDTEPRAAPDAELTMLSADAGAAAATAAAPAAAAGGVASPPALNCAQVLIGPNDSTTIAAANQPVHGPVHIAIQKLRKPLWRAGSSSQVARWQPGGDFVSPTLLQNQVPAGRCFGG